MSPWPLTGLLVNVGKGRKERWVRREKTLERKWRGCEEVGKMQGGVRWLEGRTRVMEGAEGKRWLRSEGGWCQNCKGQPGTWTWWMGGNVTLQETAIRM